MEILVSKDMKDCVDSIQKAVDMANSGDVIRIKAGIYKERVEVRKNGLTFVGDDCENTIITEEYCANMLMEDGSKRGTFRSYTFLIIADDITISNLTIENAAGFGREVGQAVALYAEGDRIRVTQCKILGHQDTLFTGPLPLTEKKPGGFVGPTETAPRRHVRQLYEKCFINGEVDFIFGSATAYFDECTLYALDRNEKINAYYTAPSTYEGQKYGYVFNNCKLTGNCPEHTAILSRPWRDYAKAVFLNCDMDECVNEAGFDDWKNEPAHKTVLYAEYNCKGLGSNTQKRVDFSHVLSDEEAALYSKNNVLEGWNI